MPRFHIHRIAALAVLLAAGMPVAASDEHGGHGEAPPAEAHPADAHGADSHAADAHAADAHGAGGGASVVLDGGEYAVPNKRGLSTGFGPLRLSLGPLIPAPSAYQGEEALRYRVRRSVERLGRQGEEPLTWNDGLSKAAFHLDQHHAEPKLVAGAAYAIESDLLMDAGQAMVLTVRLSPPTGSGDIAYAVRADIGGRPLLVNEGTLHAGGKPVDLPLSFSVGKSCDLPVSVSVAAVGIDPESGSLADGVELTLLDGGSGHEPAAVTSSRAVSAADNIVRPPYAPVIAHGAAAEGHDAAAAEGGHGGGEKKEKKDKKKDKDKDKEKKGH